MSFVPVLLGVVITLALLGAIGLMAYDTTQRPAEAERDTAAPVEAPNPARREDA